MSDSQSRGSHCLLMGLLGAVVVGLAAGIVHQLIQKVGSMPGIMRSPEYTKPGFGEAREKEMLKPGRSN